MIPSNRPHPPQSQHVPVNGAVLQTVLAGGLPPGVSPTSTPTQRQRHRSTRNANVLTSRAIEPPTCMSGPARFSCAMIHLQMIGAENHGGKISRRRGQVKPAISGVEEKNGTHAPAARMISMVKYNGLKTTIIASFHPRTTSTPYIQYGICAMLATVLRFAST